MSKLDIKFNRLTPFKRCVLQNFPFIEEDFDALTNYGLLCKIVAYLNKVIDSQNEVQGVTEEIATAFNNLYDYVKNYFDNLDVQEEINNKLDEMVEDGTLQEIIGSYLNATAIWGFDSVADMKASTNLIEGSYAQTLGYYSKEEGGAALYKIVDSEAAGNDRDIIALTNGLKAILVPIDFNVYPEQFGAKGDYDTDDATAINAAIQYAYTKGYKVILGKSYEIGSPILINQSNLVIDIRNKINYTGNTSAIIITSSYNVMNFNKIYSSGKGITFNKSVEQAGALEGNRLNVEYINSTDNCIEMISTTGGLVYNEVRFTTLISSSAHDNIYLSATGTSFVGENTFYGGKCQRGTWGVYATSDHSGGIPVVKLYNICFEGVTNGIYFNNVLASTINYPRYAELEQKEVILWSINGDTIDCVFNGNHPIDLTRVVANSSATSSRFNYINAPIMNTGGTTIAKRAGVNKNGFALEPHCVKYRNVTSSWATHTIDETEFQPQYFNGNFAATITLNNSYIPEFIPFFYVNYDGSSRLTILDQDGNTVHDGTGLAAGLYKVTIYQDGLKTKYFTTTETETA